MKYNYKTLKNWYAFKTVTFRFRMKLFCVSLQRWLTAPSVSPCHYVVMNLSNGCTNAEDKQLYIQLWLDGFRMFGILSIKIQKSINMLFYSTVVYNENYNDITSNMVIFIFVVDPKISKRRKGGIWYINWNHILLLKKFSGKE